MTETDAFKLARLEMFETIKDNLPEGSRDICDVHEDMLYLWNFKDANLVVINWRLAQSKEESNVTHQVS